MAFPDASTERPIALLDACALVGALRRDLLLTLAEGGLYRLRWSDRILDETERAIGRLLTQRGWPDAAARAARTREMMARAFEGAAVEAGDAPEDRFRNLPDPGDAHVIASAMRAGAGIIVTENLRHFPSAALGPLGLRAGVPDAFLADLLRNHPGPGVAAIRDMRERMRRPERTAELLLRDMRAVGLARTADALLEHAGEL